MAKKAKKRPPRKPVRKRSSRVEQQNRLRTIVVWSSISVAVLVVGLLSYGLFGERLVKQYIILPSKLRDPVAIVDGVPITAGDLRERVDFLQRYYMMALPEEQIGYVLDMLVQEQLLTQEVDRRGLVVTDEAVQRKIEEEYGYFRDPPTPTPVPTVTPTPAATEVVTPTLSATAVVTPAEVLTPTPTLVPVPTSAPLPSPTPMTEAGFRESYAENMSLRGISDEEYREYVRLQLAYDVLLEDYRKEVPTAMDQVQLRYLQVSTPTEADELVKRLEDGASFEDLKAEIEADAETPGYGSELRWYTQDALEQELGADVATQAFSTKSGVFSGEQTDLIVYYAVEVVDYQADRELDDDVVRQLASEPLNEWLNSRMETAVEYLDYDPGLITVGLEP